MDHGNFEASKKSGDANNRFQLRLAAQIDASTDARARIAIRRKLRVLIVDDDRDASEMLAALVDLWGHDAQCAYGGRAALALAMAATPDVVLLDLGMPEMDGCELARNLRRGAGMKGQLLIAVTGFTSEQLRKQCHEAGIDLFLVKPVEAQVMETLLMLEHQRLGLSRGVPILIDDESKKYRQAQKPVLGERLSSRPANERSAVKRS